MGLFTAIAGPLIKGGLSLLASGKEKGAIDESRRLEEEQIGANLAGLGEAKGRLFERTGTAVGAGKEGTSELQRLLIGGGRQDPTAGETFATEKAFQGIDRASAAGKRLFSGRRIEDFASTAANIGSQFRQQDIQNLFGLSGQGLQAAGIETGGDIGLTGSEAKQRELLGDVGSAATLGKTKSDIGAIQSVGAGAGNLLDLFNKKPQKTAGTAGLGRGF